MAQSEIVITSSLNNSIGVGSVRFPTWHKKQNEKIVQILGFKIEFDESVTGSEIASYKKDMTLEQMKAHVKIMEVFHQSPETQQIIRLKLGLGSMTSLKEPIILHNFEVQENGECAICKRVGSSFATVHVEKIPSKSGRKAN
ncbi:MAG: hypothetical protein JRN15_19755 [Nitrososphaerota archaeon]|nr:hypothetical protein [Nitrososphaerota archaeon]